jgi:hypothetical protein
MAELPNQNTIAQFVPTAQIFDVERVNKQELSNEDLKELLVRIYQSLNTSAAVINSKGSGVFQLGEFINNDVYFVASGDDSEGLPNQQRSVYRKVINFGAVVPGASTQPHGLTIGTTWTFVKIYGCASKTNAYYPIPNSQIGLNLDATNVNIINGTALTFTTCTVVLEYLKN